MSATTLFYIFVIYYLVSRVILFFQKKSRGDFDEKGYSGWLVRQSLLFGGGIFLWVLLLYKEQQ